MTVRTGGARTGVATVLTHVNHGTEPPPSRLPASPGEMAAGNGFVAEPFTYPRRDL